MAENNEPRLLRFDPETGRLRFYWSDRSPEDVARDGWGEWTDVFPQYAPTKEELVFLFRQWHQEMLWALWKSAILGIVETKAARLGMFSVARLSRLSAFLGKEVAERLLTEEACLFKKTLRRSAPSRFEPGMEGYEENTFEKNWERFMANEDFNVMTRDLGVRRPDAVIVASCDGNTTIEKLDVEAEPGWDAAQGYVPTRQGLVELLRHWYDRLVTARWDGAKGAEVEERLRSFAARIAKLACLLGKERTEKELGEMMASFEDKWERAALAGKRHQVFGMRWRDFVTAQGYEVATESVGTLRPGPLADNLQWCYDMKRQERERYKRRQESTYYQRFHGVPAFHDDTHFGRRAGIRGRGGHALAADAKDQPRRHQHGESWRLAESRSARARLLGTGRNPWPDSGAFFRFLASRS